ncbi:MAG: glycosyltransferase family 2 protein [Deferribacteres bacterium]|nr:glycosyltransferase family 2 protein [candidate division KSB1 bacterium]MCB9501465.1 glycosyltransferase family 2 protein [Deferribacteres bacterium]
MTAGRKKIDISVCIATFRRPKKLRRLLKSLEIAIKNVEARVEIIVVDNDAACSAKESVAHISNQMQNLHYFSEPVQNISLARNRALAQAEGHWIAFVDDDEIVEPNWLRAYWTYQKTHAADGYFGPVLPRMEEKSPLWFDAELLFHRPRFETGTRLFDKMRTGNAFIQADVFTNERFNPKYGLSGGGDAIYFALRANENRVFLWNDAAITYEIYPKERMKLSWLMQRYFRAGLNYSAFRLQQKHNRMLILTKAVVVLLFFSFTLIFRFFQSPAKGVLQFLRMCMQIGHLAACFNVVYYEYK